MLLRKLIITFILFTITSVSLAKDLNKIVAVVNDEIITQAELDQEVAKITKQLQNDKVANYDSKDVTKQVLDSIIKRKLILQHASQAGIRIDDLSLNEAINSIARENNKTLPEFEQLVAEQGINFNDFREDVRNQMTIGELERREVGQKIVVTEDEINSFLQSPQGQDKSGVEYKIAHILVALNENPTTDDLNRAKQKAQDIIAKLKEGADFNRLSVAESKADNALSGGDLGWRKLAELPTIFVADASKMQKGDLAGPIRSASGFHIIKLTDKRLTGSDKLEQQVHARHILIKTNESRSMADAKLKIKEIKTKFDKGEDFGKLAGRYSEDLASKTKGGDLGWLKQGVTMPPFEKAMNRLKVNESSIVTTDYGVHLIQVLGKRDYDNSKEVLKDMARKYVFQNKFNQEVKAWQRSLQDRAFIEIKT